MKIKLIVVIFSQTNICIRKTDDGDALY